MRNHEHEIDLDGECELLVTLERIEAKLDALKARLDAGVAAPGTRALSELGTRIRREIEKHGDEPDRCISAKWIGRLLGIDSSLIAPELDAMVADGLLYVRPFYKGKLYYRCGHGPAARTHVRGPRKDVDAKIVEAIVSIVRARRITSQASVEVLLKREFPELRRQDFWANWADLRNAKVLEKRADGVYTITRPYESKA